MRLRRSRRKTSITHIQMMWPKNSEKCSAKGWFHGAGTMPMAGMNTTWNPT